VLSRLPKVTDERLIAGSGTFDDASVFRLSAELGLVETVDVMDPIGQDFYRFGRVAAANSLSDVYAMGGEPLVVMNVVCTPATADDMESLYDLLRGAEEIVLEAGAAIGGGHTTVSESFKFGLAVTGRVDPEKFVPIGGARPGDALVLSKPLGVMSMLRGQLAAHPQHPQLERAYAVMEQLNREAAHAMVDLGAHACTDVTGFGFLGHLSQMMEESRATARVSAAEVPCIDGALEHALIHSWDRALNLHSFSPGVRLDGEVDERRLNVLYEADTSGGLVIALAPERVGELLARLRETGIDAAQFGEVGPAEAGCQVVLGP